MGTSKHTQVHFFAAAEYPRSHSSSISLAALAAILAIFSLSGCGGLASTEKKTSRITLTVNSSSINFGNISVGSSATQSLIITNIGIPAVNVSQATISGAGFALVGANLTYSIPGGQSSTIQIQFAPLSTGDVTGSLSILSNASNPLLAIALAGTGAQPGLATSPASVNFGNVTVGQNSSQNIKLTNSGNADLALSLATVSGNGFGISGLSVPTTISPGQSLSFNGHFAPTAAGGATGSITFADNAAGSPQTLTLSGSGVTASATLSANPGSIAFGNIVVGNTSTQTITLANSGSTNVTISQISSSGTGFNASGLATPMTLAAGQSATFTAQFAPAAAGNTSGSITLTSDASNPTLTIALSGTGTQGQLAANPASVSFGNVLVGSSGSQTVTLTNSGTASVTLSAASASGTGFSISGLSLPLTLAAGQNTTFTAQFAPSATGSASGTASITSNAPGSPLTIALSGTGVAATFLLGANPASLSYGNVNVGSTGSLAVTLTNSGNSNVTVSSVTVTGTGFSASGVSAGATLTPNQSVTLNVAFAPTAAGSVTGSVSVASNATNSPATIGLSGTAVQGTLASNPASVSFGNVLVGSSASQTVTLTNSGTASVTISAASASGTGFSISGLSLPLTLAAGQNTTFTAQFAPSATGSASGTASITSNAPGSPLTIALSGTGTQPQLSPTPTSVSFGSLVTGNNTSQTITLKNSGTASLTISQATVSGAGFTITGLTVPVTIAAGGSTTFSAAFAPTTAGSVTGSVSLVSNAPGSPLAIPLSGTGVAATFLLGANPTSLSFGNVNVAGSSSLSATLTNTGNSNVTVSSVTVTGTGFSASGVSAGTTLTPNQSLTLNVAFAPTAAGSVTGSVSVASNATNSPATISLSGTAVQGTLAANPASVSFGNVLVGSSGSQTVTLTNSGTASVTLSAASASGTGFSISGLSLPLTLAAGQNTTFTAQFAPSATGSASGTASITSNAPGSPLTIALSGTGTQPQLSPTPTSVSFGSLVTGTNTSQTITLKNTGTASLTISQATVSGAGFTITGLTVPVTIAAGGSTTFSAAFAPTTAGSVTGSISLVSNAPGSPLAILLSGTGVAATFLLGANPTSLSFGNVNVAGSSSLSATLTNTGNSNVTVSSVTVTGTGFSSSGVSAGTNLTPNQSLTLNVAFAPTAAGSVTGSVSVASNATNSPAVISLSGAGVQPQISVVPASVSFGNVVVGTKNTQTITLKNTGTANLSVSQATVSGSGFATSGLTLPLTLTPGQSTNFSVAFAPAGVGSVTGSVSLVSNAPGSPTAIPLSGSGVAATLQLSASPTSLSFGNVSVGSSITQSVTLTNTGNSSVSISQINVSGVAFSASGLTPPLTLAAGQSTNFSVIFLPATSGSLTGSVSVVSNATNSPATIALSGTGVSHSVTLSWTASTSSVVGYYVYRGTLTGGPYTKLNSTPLVTITYDDSTVQSGLIYFYVVTAMDSNNVESVHSNEISATIPIP